jgi:hypothetical protein
LEQGGSQTSSVNAKGHILKIVCHVTGEGRDFTIFVLLSKILILIRLVPKFNVIFSKKFEVTMVIQNKLVYVYTIKQYGGMDN